MKNVIIYTSTICPYCVRAKNLLRKKGVAYQELNIDTDFKYIDQAIEKSGGRTTVPQIFIDDYHVGGCDELYALDKENKLDELLGI
jgi:GrxC family glutaredoxin